LITISTGFEQTRQKQPSPPFLFDALAFSIFNNSSATQKGQKIKCPQSDSSIGRGIRMAWHPSAFRFVLFPMSRCVSAKTMDHVRHLGRILSTLPCRIHDGSASRHRLFCIPNDPHWSSSPNANEG
jgi:hypothetical protein